jgi:hypothetical protein
MTEPLIVRLFVPFGVALTLFFAVDFVLALRLLTRPASQVSPRERRRTGLLGLAGLALVMLLGMAGAMTAAYRWHANPGHPMGEGHRRRTRLELLAFLVPITVGGISGLTLRLIERARRSQV